MHFIILNHLADIEGWFGFRKIDNIFHSNSGNFCHEIFSEKIRNSWSQKEILMAKKYWQKKGSRKASIIYFEALEVITICNFKYQLEWWV